MSGLRVDDSRKSQVVARPGFEFPGDPSRATGSKAPHPKPGFPLAARRPGSYLFFHRDLSLFGLTNGTAGRRFIYQVLKGIYGTSDLYNRIYATSG